MVFFCYSNAADNCPNFSGKYRWVSDDKEAQIDLSVEQNQCISSTYSFQNGDGLSIVQKHIFDSQKYLVEENSDDGFKAYETARISSQQVLIEEERHESSENQAQERVYYVNLQINLTSDGNLVILKKTLDANHVETDSSETLYRKLGN